MAVPAGHPEKPQGDDGRAMLERMNGGAHEQLALWGLSHVQLSDGARVLDVGCGGGANLARILAMGTDVHADGVDYSPLSVEMSLEYNADAVGEGRCSVIEADVCALPFEEGTYSMVTAFETVYFWPDIQAALAEVRRVLMEGGMFLVCNEANGQLEAANQIAAEIEGMSVYTAADFAEMLPAAGFEVVEIDDEGEAGRIAVVARAM